MVSFVPVVDNTKYFCETDKWYIPENGEHREKFPGVSDWREEHPHILTPFKQGDVGCKINLSTGNLIFNQLYSSFSVWSLFLKAWVKMVGEKTWSRSHGNYLLPILLKATFPDFCVDYRALHIVCDSIWQ